MKAPYDFRRLDARPLPVGNKEVRAFMVVRNERLRLPAVLEHHRRLGVDRFFVVDNDSTDGTVEFLLDQPDLHVFQSRDSFAASQCGYAWTNTLLEMFGADGWCLTIDADEHFIYPHYEDMGLHSLCAMLDATGARAMFTLFLDMYSDQTIQQTAYKAGASLMETCPFFDALPYRCVQAEHFPSLQIYGGVRERVFWNKDEGSHPPTLSQIPLVRWQSGMRYLLCRHAMTPVPLSPVTGALLHYKFLFDFKDRAKTEAVRGEHFSDGREYKNYARVLDGQNDLCLKAEQSVRLSGSGQLVDLGLMASSAIWNAQAKLPPLVNDSCREAAN